MQVRGVIKIPTPQLPPSPPTLPPVPAPIFDYIIDIYADKVVVADSYGNTVAVLSTVSDLNSWLSSVRGKRIRINAHVEVYDTLLLTSNEYWIFGEWIHSSIYLLDKDITIYSFTNLADFLMKNFIDNAPPPDYTERDISGFKLFAPYADLNISAPMGTTLSDIMINVGRTSHSTLHGIDGDIHIMGSNIYITNSKLRNAVILAHYLGLEAACNQGYEGSWFIVSLQDTERSNISTRDCGWVTSYLRFVRIVNVGANSITNLFLEIPDTWGGTVTVDGIYTLSGDTISALNPAPSGITYQIDPNQKAIVITNSTPNDYTLVIIYTWTEPQVPFGNQGVY
jgi:hypothetical protein